MRYSFGIIAVGVFAVPAFASPEIQYGPPPSWTVAPPAPTAAVAAPGAAVRVQHFDTQIRLGPDGDEYYISYRVKLLSAEALGAGRIVVPWSPDQDRLTVHALKVHRDGQVRDVLKNERFEILRREDNLERSMLDGRLTAVLQVQDLRVGDEIEFVTTTRRRNTVLGTRSQGLVFVPPVGGPGAYRVRLQWPKGDPVRWRATSDLGDQKPTEFGPDLVLAYELRDPEAPIVTEGAPSRYNIRRLVEFTEFTDWGEVADLFRPLYAEAARLGPNSPLKAEAARIAAEAKTPAERAEAALRLVQDQVRYVYVGLNEGGMRPTSADETWSRRFGDCKAKSALLIALLNELGVPSEAVLVNASGGDGTDERLPTPAVFDHVVVRAMIDGRSFWLDGARLGDRSLDHLPLPTFQWALPLRPAASLERVERPAPILADSSVVLEIDAAGGLDAPASIQAERVVRGDPAYHTKVGLAQATQAEAERTLLEHWEGLLEWVEPSKVEWRYDERRRELVLTMAGSGRVPWKTGDNDVRYWNVFDGHFYEPDEFRRSKTQDQSAPWAVAFPESVRTTVVMRLPKPRPGTRWTYRSPWVSWLVGADWYRRDAALTDGLFLMTRSTRTMKPEVTVEEAKVANERRLQLDTDYVQVFETSAAAPEPSKASGGDAFSLAQSASAAGEIREALRQVRVSRKTEGDSFEKAAFEALMLSALDRHEQALRTIDRAGSDPRVGSVRAELLANSGRLDQALAAAEQAYREHGDVPGVGATYADMLRRAGRQEESLPVYERAIQKQPDNLVARRGRIAVLASLKRYEEALAEADRVVQLDAQAGINFRNRANVLFRLDRLDAALADAEEAMRFDPTDSISVGALTRILRELKRTEDAVRLNEKQLEYGRTAQRLNNLCYERVLSGDDLNAAERECAEALKLEDSAAIWDSYGYVALLAGRLADAEKRFDKALKLSPKLANALYGRGLVKSRRGDKVGGLADIEKARTLSPNVGEELEAAGLRP